MLSRAAHTLVPGTFVGSATDTTMGVQVGPALLLRVQSPDRCAGRGCVVHHPSEHHMQDWPMTWRGDRAQVDRSCRHGVGHPDPDDLAYLASLGLSNADVHGCGGCC